MKEVLKNLISQNPLIAIVLLVTGFVYLLLAFYLISKNRKLATALEISFVFYVLFVLPEPKIQPFVQLALPYMYEHGGGIIWPTVQIFIYVSVILLLNARFRIIKNLEMMFYDPFSGGMLFLACLSVLWSPTPIRTVKACIALFITYFMAAQIARRYNWQELSRLLRWSTGIIALLSTFYSLFVPAIGIHGKGWMGIMVHPNRLGILMTVNTALWFFQALNEPQRRWLSWGMCFLSLYVTQNTNSATSKVLTITLIFLLLWLPVLKRMSFKWAFTLILVFIVFNMCATILIVENIETIVVDYLGKDLTLTGRTYIWPVVIREIAKRPLFGYGYQSFWQPWLGVNNPAFDAKTEQGHNIAHAHMGFLEIPLEIGWLGFGLFVCSVFIFITRSVWCMTQTKDLESILPLVFLTWMLIQNMTISELFTPRHVWFYYILWSMRVSIELRQQAKANEKLNLNSSPFPSHQNLA